MNKKLNPVVIVVAVVVLLAGMGAAAFYQEEVAGFIRLQGWNTGPVTEASQQFIKAAASKDGKKVATFLAQGAPLLEPVSGPGGITAFKIGDYGGPKRRALKEMCPSDSPKLSSPKLVFLDGGSAQVEATYPNHRLQMTWDRKPEGWKLIALGWVQ
ncbi:MAG: hypothetical protein ACO1SX_29440 [Actinomycetota bacterium]